MANPPNTRGSKKNPRKIQEDISVGEEGPRRSSPPPADNSRRSTRQNSKQLPLDSFLAPRSSSPFDSPVASGAEDGSHSAKRQRAPPKNSSLAIEEKADHDLSSALKDASDSKMKGKGFELSFFLLCH